MSFCREKRKEDLERQGGREREREKKRERKRERDDGKALNVLALFLLFALKAEIH